MSFYPTSGYSKPQHVPRAHYTGLEANKTNDYEYLEVGGGETGTCLYGADFVDFIEFLKVLFLELCNRIVLRFFALKPVEKFCHS